MEKQQKGLVPCYILFLLPVAPATTRKVQILIIIMNTYCNLSLLVGFASNPKGGGLIFYQYHYHSMPVSLLFI